MPRVPGPVDCVSQVTIGSQGSDGPELVLDLLNSSSRRESALRHLSIGNQPFLTRISPRLKPDQSPINSLAGLN
jgi:hypothetical protein